MRSNVKRSEDNVYYLVRPQTRVPAVSLAQNKRARQILVIGSSILAGALLGFGLANLPALSAAIATVLHLPMHQL
ncbi:MAG: hypothetical protein ABSE22_19365 [Xanthobacteraceae bacterium]|jgi:hypothetical protein